MTTMGRFARVTGPGTLEIHDIAVAGPGHGQVLVEITLCGVCGTDTHSFLAGRTGASATFGHEWVGRVLAVGEDTEGPAPGTRVVPGTRAACGHCRLCLLGDPEHCEAVFEQVKGTGPDTPGHGGFATHLLVAANRVLVVPDGLADVRAAMTEPLAVARHAVRRGPPPEDSVAVVLGAGPIGILTAQVVRSGGASRVLVVEPSPTRRDVVRELGFTDVAAPGSEAAELARVRTGGVGADIAYECSAAPTVLRDAPALLRRGGHLVLLGFPFTDQVVSYADWQNRELTVTASIAYTRADVSAALTDRNIRVEPLHTGTVGLDALAERLSERHGGNPAGLKTMVNPDQ